MKASQECSISHAQMMNNLELDKCSNKIYSFRTRTIRINHLLEMVCSPNRFDKYGLTGNIKIGTLILCLLIDLFVMKGVSYHGMKRKFNKIAHRFDTASRSYYEDHFVYQCYFLSTETEVARRPSTIRSTH